MNDCKVWKNRFFELKIYNVGIMSIQTSLLIGLLATLIITKSPVVHKLCVVFLLLDFAANLTVLLMTSSFSTESSSSDKPETQCNTTVEHSRTQANVQQAVNQQSNRSKNNSVINNKVPVPVQKPSNTNQPEAANSETVAAQKDDNKINMEIDKRTEAIEKMRREAVPTTASIIDTHNMLDSMWDQGE